MSNSKLTVLVPPEFEKEITFEFEKVQIFQHRFFTQPPTPKPPKPFGTVVVADFPENISKDLINLIDNYFKSKQ